MASKHAAAEAIKVRVIFVNSHLSFRCLGVIAALFFVLFIFLAEHILHIFNYTKSRPICQPKNVKKTKAITHKVSARYLCVITIKSCGEKFLRSFLHIRLFIPMPHPVSS